MLFTVVYGILIILRFGCTILPGYIHPDEFFQGGQELLFGTVRTWEWKDDAARSILPPLWMSWLPIKFMSHPSALFIWLAPRLWMACLSLILDIVCWKLTSRNRQSMLFLASAWPTLIFHTRPWSNCLESIAIALLLLIVSSSKNGWTHNLFMGSVAAAGFWTRFTFSFFAFPICIHQLCKPSFLKTLLGLAVGFLLTGFILVYIDILFYHGAFAWDQIPKTITPLNIFLYNIDVQGNLAQHGLHFQGLHALVNMPMLFSVTGVWFYWDLLYGERTTLAQNLTTLCRLMIISGIILLSCSPHQEPRYILPCLLPLCILASRMTVSPWALKLWIGSNVLIGLFWGVLHQGQVTNSLLALQGTNVTVMYWRTYMPPTFLTQTCNDATKECSTVDIIDKKDSNHVEIMTALTTMLDCRLPREEAIYLVTPTLYSDLFDFSSTACRVPSYECSLIQSHWPHVTTEYLPTWRGSVTSIFHDLQLGVYLITCPLPKIIEHE